jgi:DNA-binding CsgD family transcriptional regulator
MGNLGSVVYILNGDAAVRQQATDQLADFGVASIGFGSLPELLEYVVNPQDVVDAKSAVIHRRFEHLSPRERQVFALAASGLRNKQAAAILGISNVTLQIHRSRVMRKMAAGSFAALVRMGGALNLPMSIPR